MRSNIRQLRYKSMSVGARDFDKADEFFRKVVKIGLAVVVFLLIFSIKFR